MWPLVWHYWSPWPVLRFVEEQVDNNEIDLLRSFNEVAPGCPTLEPELLKLLDHHIDISLVRCLIGKILLEQRSGDFRKGIAQAPYGCHIGIIGHQLIETSVFRILICSFDKLALFGGKVVIEDRPSLVLGSNIRRCRHGVADVIHHESGCYSLLRQKGSKRHTCAPAGNSRTNLWSLPVSGSRSSSNSSVPPLCMAASRAM